MQQSLPHLPWLLAALGIAACTVEPDYAGTRYRCDANGTCPDGQICVEGMCASGDPDLTDDAFDGEFGAGSYDRTLWDGVEVRLEGAETEGSFESRIFDAGGEVEWRSIQWRPSAPYGKPLPDDRAAEDGYPEDAIDMADNVLLLHVELAAGPGDGDELPDASGRGNDPIAHSGSSIEVIAGRIGTAIVTGPSVSGADFLSVASDTGSDLEFRRDDFSFAAWVRTGAETDFDGVVLGGESGEGTHFWFGGSPSTGSAMGECPAGAAGLRPVAVLISDQGNSTDGALLCGTGAINDSEWHHLAATKEGHDVANVTLYVDGSVAVARPATFVKTMLLPGAPPVTIGKFPIPTDSERSPFDGAIDELAVWRRALTADEISALYRRGATRLSVRVRACVQADCSDAAYPALGAAGTLVDPAGGLTPPAPVALDLPRTRYLQYRVDLEAGAGASAGFRAVAINAMP